jgi:hypothetical protein
MPRHPSQASWTQFLKMPTDELWNNVSIRIRSRLCDCRDFCGIFAAAVRWGFCAIFTCACLCLHGVHSVLASLVGASGWTLGILRLFRAFFPGLARHLCLRQGAGRAGWLRVFPATKQNPSPAQRQYPVKSTRDRPQTVRQ